MLSPGVRCDSTAQGDKVTPTYIHTHTVVENIIISVELGLYSNVLGVEDLILAKY